MKFKKERKRERKKESVVVEESEPCHPKKGHKLFQANYKASKAKAIPLNLFSQQNIKKVF